MSYTLLRGAFVIRYPDLPRGGPEPDGDTIKFLPDAPGLVEALPRISGRAPDLNARGISVRLEAIDALETHFSETHQELLGANAGRDALLAQLGFTGVMFWADLPNKVQAADQDAVRGHVLSNGIDANGRMIGFAYPGDPAGPDGGSVFVDNDLADASVNASLLASGHAYPAFYGTLPATLRTHLADVSRGARGAQPPRGLWARSTADPDGPAAVADLAALEQLVMWPKLFRRIVPTSPRGSLILMGSMPGFVPTPSTVTTNCSCSTGLSTATCTTSSRPRACRSSSPSGRKTSSSAPTRPPRARPRAGAPSPPGISSSWPRSPTQSGPTRARESITVLNATALPIDVAGWQLIDVAHTRHTLAGTLAGGGSLQIQLDASLRLGNKGDTLVLVDNRGDTIDQVTYEGRDVQPGLTICFGR
jgi:hypothetical protein